MKQKRPKLIFDDNARAVLADIAKTIRGLEKHSIANVVETGRLLNEARKTVIHGEWLKWLAAEFAWSSRTADRYYNVYKLSESVGGFDGLNVSLSALYVMVDLMYSLNSHDQRALAKIVETARERRMTKRLALEILTPVKAPPLVPTTPAPRVSNTQKKNIHSALYQLGRAVKYGLDVWEAEAQGMDPVKLRTIIDRLEMIYQTRTASRFEDA